MRNRHYLSYLLMIAGAAMFAAGLLGVKAAADAQGMMQALPYIGIGLGSGIFGHGAGEVINRWAEKRDPKAARSRRIEKNDERNIAVANRAKAKALHIMIFVFGALNLAFALMGVDVIIILLSVFAYLFVLGSGLYYWMQYNKEM